jgi:sugar (pentulose or hexulose) kinase
VFRVRELVEALSTGGDVSAIRLTGGPANEPCIPGMLAACLQRPIERLAEAEATLLGAACLAAGRSAWPAVPATTVDPGPGGRYLARKYERWRRWLRAEVFPPA